MASPGGPSAATIAVTETLELLDGDAHAVAEGVVNGRYALWLGSGISINNVPGLSGAVRNVLELLQGRADTADPECAHHRALQKAIDLAKLRKHELEALDLTRPVAEWPYLAEILESLVERYSDLLNIIVDGEKTDYLLWEGVDVKATYATPADPGAEHLCIAILALEGAIHDIPSANWDGLIEAAVRELAEVPDHALKVIVFGEELRDAGAAPRLLKFHGCAVLAAQDEDRYRPALIGAKAQITAWTEDDGSKVMCNALKTLAAERRTLMIGLSAQDTDIQDVFNKATGLMPWEWPTDSPAYVFAEEQIGTMQQNLLRVVYREYYERYGAAIEESARIRAYAEPLLIALVLWLLESKLDAFIRAARAPGIPEGERQTIAAGIRHIRDRAAEQFEPDRLAAMRMMIGFQSRTLAMFREGDEPASAETAYRPLSDRPAELVASDPDLATGGMPGFATAVGILGVGESEGQWTLGAVATASDMPDALSVTAGTGSEARIHFAANAGVAIKQERLPFVIAEPENTIMIHSSPPIPASARNPSGTFGRTGAARIRDVNIEELLESCTSAAELVQRFRFDAAI